MRQSSKKCFITALCEYDPSAIRDSVRRKVSGWFKDTQPDDRKMLIKFCFDMKLSEQWANTFLSVCGDGDFHTRDPQELGCVY